MADSLPIHPHLTALFKLYPLMLTFLVELASWEGTCTVLWPPLITLILQTGSAVRMLALALPTWVTPPIIVPMLSQISSTLWVYAHSIPRLVVLHNKFHSMQAIIRMWQLINLEKENHVSTRWLPSVHLQHLMLNLTSQEFNLPMSQSDIRILPRTHHSQETLLIILMQLFKTLHSLNMPVITPHGHQTMLRTTPSLKIHQLTVLNPLTPVVILSITHMKEMEVRASQLLTTQIPQSPETKLWTQLTTIMLQLQRIKHCTQATRVITPADPKTSTVQTVQFQRNSNTTQVLHLTQACMVVITQFMGIRAFKTWLTKILLHVRIKPICTRPVLWMVQ